MLIKKLIETLTLGEIELRKRIHMADWGFVLLFVVVHMSRRVALMPLNPSTG